MPYIPKSQYDIKHTNGGELYNPATGEEYNGEYIQYGQKYFAGNTITNLKVKLSKIDNEENLVLKNTRNFLYNQLNPKQYKRLKTRSNPVASKPRPTEEDYTKGVWRRYFCQRANNENEIFEMNLEGYNKLKKGEYDNILYTYGDIMWSLRDIQSNNNNVLKMIRQYPGIQLLFNNPREFVKAPPGFHYMPDGKLMEGNSHPSPLPPPTPPETPSPIPPETTSPPPPSYSGGSGGY